MKLRNVLLAVLPFVASAAMAADNGSQYQWQTPADRFEVTPTLGYSYEKQKYKDGTNTETSGLYESVRGEYGISDMFSVGLLLKNVNMDVKPSGEGKISQSGLVDPTLYLNGRTPLDGASLRFGLALDLGLGKAKYDSSGTAQKNAMSGGLALTPYVGYETMVGQGYLGARLSYKVWLGDRKAEIEDSSADIKYKGGNVLTPALYYEAKMDTLTLGAAVELNYVQKSKYTNGNNPEVELGNGRTTWDVALYAPYEITPDITLLPQFTYGQWSAYDTSTIDNVNFWDVKVGARFGF